MDFLIPGNVLFNCHAAISRVKQQQAGTAAPVLPSQAASKKVTVSVKSPKKGVKLSGSKLTIHKKGKVVLTVKSGKSNVTKKATVKSSNKKVLMFGGGER